MIRLVGIATSLVLFFGSPAVVLSCTAAHQTCCCCANMGKTCTGHCPTMKAAASPVSAVLSDGIDLSPVMLSFERVADISPVSMSAVRFVWLHDAQAPPDRAAFRSPASLRAPPALLA